MIDVAKDAISLAEHLLLGFVAAWIFYGLTAYPKPSTFERTVQALILTAIIRVIVIPIRASLLGVGAVVSIGSWTAQVEFVWSALVAVSVGHMLAWGANSNKYHSLLGKCKITSRTSWPSQWFSAFHCNNRYVTLHTKCGRRLRGWPAQWPDLPESGHFLMQKPEWLLDDNTAVPVLTDEFILISGTNVEMVEFLFDEDSLQGAVSEIQKAERILIDANTTESRNDEACDH